MIHSKGSTRGFTLIEVLFALAIMGSVLTPLFMNQSTLLQFIARRSIRLHRIYLGEEFMNNSYIKLEQDKKQRTATLHHDDPETTLKFKIEDPRQSIKKLFRDVYVADITIEWKENSANYADKLVTFLFLPELEKS